MGYKKHQKYDSTNREFSQDLYDEFCNICNVVEVDWINSFDSTVKYLFPDSYELFDDGYKWHRIPSQLDDDHPQCFQSKGSKKHRLLVTHEYNVEWEYDGTKDPEAEEYKQEQITCAAEHGVTLIYPEFPSWYYPGATTLVVWARHTDSALIDRIRKLHKTEDQWINKKQIWIKNNWNKEKEAINE